MRSLSGGVEVRGRVILDRCPATRDGLFGGDGDGGGDEFASQYDDDPSPAWRPPEITLGDWLTLVLDPT